jgi:hypothetical protein
LVLILQAALFDIFLRELEPLVGVDIIAAKAELSHGHHRHKAALKFRLVNPHTSLKAHSPW